MRLGASIGYFGVGVTPRDSLELAVRAERLGYDSIWVGEPYGNDAPTILAWFAGATERIKLGSGIMAIPGRTATMTAQTAATLDLISDGRLILGLGTSGPQVSEGWHGVPFARQLTRTREYVEVIRMALRREVVEYHGETIDLPLAGSAQGKPLKLIITPLRADVPIQLAAMGPKNTALCGEIADGWLPLWYSPDHRDLLHAPLIEGAERAGRDPAAIEVNPSVMVRIGDDIEESRALMKAALALYVGGMGSRERNFYNDLVCRYGYERPAKRCQDLYLAGDKAGAAAELPDELVDLVCLCGPAQRVSARLRDYSVAGVDTLVAIPAALGGQEMGEQLTLLARAATDAGVLDSVAA